MADRSMLAVSKLDNFKQWLKQHGFEICQVKGEYEALRATKKGRKYPLIVYKRLSSKSGNEIAHLSVLDRDMATVKVFMKGE